MPIMEIHPQNVTALDGKEATISCRAFGAPNPNVTWIYNSEYFKDYKLYFLLPNFY